MHSVHVSCKEPVRVLDNEKQMKNSSKSAASDQIAFASLMSGAYGSAAIALIFLVVDGLRGEGLFTPSLMGSVFFLGASPETVDGVRLDMVALYSIVHLTFFLAVGLAATLAYIRVEWFQRQPLLLTLALLTALTLGIAGLDVLVFPGLIGAIGLMAITLANTAAAGVMTWFIHSTLVKGNPATTVGTSASP